MTGVRRMDRTGAGDADVPAPPRSMYRPEARFSDDDGLNYSAGLSYT